MNVFFRFSCLLLLLLGLAACGGKSTGPYSGPPSRDVLVYPQDLFAYVDAAGGTRPLLDFSEQLAAAERQKEAWHRPWRLTRPARWIQDSLAKNFNMNPAGAYTNDYRPFPPELWNALVANSNKGAFGRGAGPAITVRATNLRAMPTERHFFRQPDLPGEGYPFDYFQHSSIPPGMPLYICNVSRDKQWVLVDTPITAGWIPARDVARVNPDFMERWKSLPLAAIVRDNTTVGTLRADIGTLLPQAPSQTVDAAPGFGPALREALHVYYPVKVASGQADTLGRAAISLATIAPGAAAVVPLQLTAWAVAEVGSPMLGQAYGWGGLDGLCDCSALTRDLLIPFGIHLPRHSANQARAGRVIELGHLSNAEKEATIIAKGAPFRSLVWFRGHIGVYIGEYKGRAMYFHNMWGLRIKDAEGGCTGRAIVGKGVITTLQPGLERPDLCHPGSFLDRVEKLTILPQ